MVEQPKVQTPWELLATDIVGPLPRSSARFVYILVVADCFSKFSVVFGLRKATAKEIIKKLEELVFLIFGVPKVLIADNGTQFKSREFQNFLNTYLFDIHFNAHYHPQANPMERVNRNII